MAKTISKGYVDTHTTPKTISIPDLDFGDDFRTKSSTADSAVLTNLTSPRDRTENLQFGYTEIADVYKGTSIDPSVYAVSHRGVQIMSKVTDVFSLTDSADPNFRNDFPVSAHVVIRVPASEFISSQDAIDLAARAISGLFDTGVTSTTRISSVLKGALVPKEL